MKKTIKMLLYPLFILLAFYPIGLAILYFTQEKLLFFPERLSQNYKFEFSGNFEEIWIETSDNHKLNALFFKSDSAKGVIIYLHGNAGALDSWGDIAGYYTNLGFNIIIPDYRGFGKSSGKIYSKDQVFDDVQRVYNYTKQSYSEDKIVVIGYSIGTGPATYLAAKNNPKKLALLAPYYNLPDLMHFHYKIIPSFILKYQFMTNEYIKEVKAPIALFHGNKDELIYYKSSEKLFKLCKPSDKLYILSNQVHGGVNENSDYRKYFKQFIIE